MMLKDLKIITFNISCSDDPDGNSIDELAPRLQQILARYPADIIGFQEYRPQWAPYISRYYEADYEMFNKYRCSEGWLESSPILWKRDKFDCLDTGYFWFSDTPDVESKGWDEEYDCHRMCAYVTLRERAGGQIFTVMNVHFGFGDAGQCKSAELLYARSQLVKSDAVFVIGDFNLEPDKVAYSILEKYFTDVNAVTTRDMRTTYHGYTPETITDRHLDFCFANRFVTPVLCHRIDDTINGKFPSDHFGLYIQLKV